MPDSTTLTDLLTKLLPTAFILALVFGGLLLWALRRIMIRKRKRAFTAELSNFSNRAVTLWDRIEALTHRHQFLPYGTTDQQAPLSGATRDRYQKIEQDLEALRRCWLNLMDEHETGESVLARGRLSPDKLRALKDELEAVNRTADPEPVLAACEEGLAALEAAPGKNKSLLASHMQKLEAVQARVNELAAAGIPMVIYDSECRVIADVLAEGRDGWAGDPLGATAYLEATGVRLENLETALSHLSEGLEQIRKVARSVKATGTVTTQRRASGELLAEEGIRPDTCLMEVQHEQSKALRALGRGDRSALNLHLDRVTVLMASVQDGLQRHDEARSFALAALKSGQAETARLRERLTEVQADVDSLPEDYATQVVQDIHQELKQAQALIEGFGDGLDQAERAMDDDRQHYLAAEEQLHIVQQQQAQADELLSQINERLSALQLTKQDSLARRLSLVQTLNELEQRVERNPDAISGSVRTLLTSARELWKQITTAMDGRPIDWPAVSAQLDQMDEAMADIRAEVDEDIHARGEYLKTFENIEEQMKALEGFLDTQSDDRRQVNEDCVRARDELKVLESDRHKPDADWNDLFMRLSDLGSDLVEIRQRAQEDMRLAGEAAQAITQAEHGVQEAQGFYSRGISAPTASFQPSLAQARRHLEAQQYEEAVACAHQVAQGARQTLSKARQQARQKQQALVQRRLQTAMSVFVQGSRMVNSLSRIGRMIGRG